MPNHSRTRTNPDHAEFACSRGAAQPCCFTPYCREPTGRDKKIMTARIPTHFGDFPSRLDTPIAPELAIADPPATIQDSDRG